MGPEPFQARDHKPAARHVIQNDQRLFVVALQFFHVLFKGQQANSTLAHGQDHQLCTCNAYRTLSDQVSHRQTCILGP